MCAGLNISPERTDIPSGFYADHWGRDGGDRQTIQASVQGHCDPSKNASDEPVHTPALTRLTDARLDA